MDHVLNVVVMGRACRNTANIKNRQPIAAMYVKAPIRIVRILYRDHRRRAECKRSKIHR